jgi:glycosyltransferase involved in cell wall biosynthesis
MDISLIICTRDRCQQLARCLQFVRGIIFERSWEVIVVNNGSIDGTGTVVQNFISSNSLSVRYIFEPKLGKSNALNSGLENARGDIIAFTDDDCYPVPDFLSAIWKVFQSPSVDYMVGRVMLHDPADHPIAVNESLTPVTYRGRSFLSGGLGFFGGGNMAFRRNIIVEIGGFDPMFGPGSRFRYAEDLDVIGRASAMGYEGRYCPDVVVRHHHQRKKSDTPAVWKACGIGTGAYHMKLLLTYREWWWFLKSIALLGLHFRISRRMFLWEPVGAARYAYWWMTARPRSRFYVAGDS